MGEIFTPSETQQWAQARRSAFVQDVLAAFTQRPADLLPFEEMRQKLRLSNVRYLGKYVVTSLDEDHCPCNDIPGMLHWAEMGDVAALIAPRPVMFVNGRRDPASNPSARESFAIAHHVYRLLGVPRRARFIEPEDMGHYFDNQLAINWFRRWLAPGQSHRGTQHAPR